MSNNIAIYNFKGGVGKTTTVLNLGFEWSRFFKVLLIDGDPQCNLSNVLARGSSNHSFYQNIKHLLHDRAPNLEPVEITPYLHLIRGDYRMVEVESNNQFITFGAEFLQRYFSYVSNDYDLIIIDCPTNFGIQVKALLENINSLLIPTVPDTFSITGIQTLTKYLSTLHTPKAVNILGIFFNMYRNGTIQNRQILELSKELFGDIILETTISTSVKVREAASLGKPISEYLPDNTVSKEFQALCDELMDKLNQVKKLDIDVLYDKLKTIHASA